MHFISKSFLFLHEIQICQCTFFYEQQWFHENDNIFHIISVASHMWLSSLGGHWLIGSHMGVGAVYGFIIFNFFTHLFGILRGSSPCTWWCHWNQTSKFFNILQYWHNRANNNQIQYDSYKNIMSEKIVLSTFMDDRLHRVLFLQSQYLKLSADIV